LSPYYAREFQRIREGKRARFNWAAFVFGVLWCVYRGLWLTALGGLVAIVVTGGIGAPFLWLFWGWRGNYLYYCRVELDKQEMV
jgi:hypothetical protein